MVQHKKVKCENKYEMQNTSLFGTQFHFACTTILSRMNCNNQIYSIVVLFTYTILSLWKVSTWIMAILHILFLSHKVSLFQKFLKFLGYLNLLLKVFQADMCLIYGIFFLKHFFHIFMKKFMLLLSYSNGAWLRRNIPQTLAASYATIVLSNNSLFFDINIV